MVATSTLRMTDLSKQRKYSTDLSGELTPKHTLEQAIDRFLEKTATPRHGHRWVAVSRGRRLDKKMPLADLPEIDADVRVLPEATAGEA